MTEDILVFCPKSLSLNSVSSGLLAQFRLHQSVPNSSDGQVRRKGLVEMKISSVIIRDLLLYRDEFANFYT